MAAGGDRRTKRRISRFVTIRIVNPVVRRLAERGLGGGAVSLLETTGRKSGQKRVTPVGHGLLTGAPTTPRCGWWARSTW
jgi:F420H(2)-dependent quinone reductase